MSIFSDVFMFSVEYAAIGWHDFVVVETINFREDEAGEIFILYSGKCLRDRLFTDGSKNENS